MFGAREIIRWGVSPAWAKEGNVQETISVKNTSAFFISFTLNTTQNKKSPRLRREDCTLVYFILNRRPEASPDFSGYRSSSTGRCLGA